MCWELEGGLLLGIRLGRFENISASGIVDLQRDVLGVLCFPLCGRLFYFGFGNNGGTVVTDTAGVVSNRARGFIGEFIVKECLSRR